MKSKMISYFIIPIISILCVGDDLSVSSIRKGKHKEASEQKMSQKLVKESTYQKVLDQVFPRSDLFSSKTLYVINIRYLPNNEPESQITLLRGMKGSTVIKREARDNIYQALNNMLEDNIEEDAAKMAERLVVIQKELSISSRQVKSLHEGFLASLPKTIKILSQEGALLEDTGREKLLLHGTVYELKYEQSGNIISLSLYDSGVEKDNSVYSLTDWMKSLKKSINALK